MRFVPNPAFESELRRDREVRADVHEFAEDTAETANKNVRAMYRPQVMTPFMPRGGYRGRGGRQPVRAVAVAAANFQTTSASSYVENVDHGAHLYEWGSSKTPALAPLRRAARKHARLEETSKVYGHW